MTKFKDKYRIQSTRLPGWDYTTTAWYFVTLCTANHRCTLGEILDAEMHLSPVGEIVAEEWQKTPHIRTNVILDEWIVMPNHLHSILIIEQIGRMRIDHSAASTQPQLKAGSLGAIIGQIKSVCTKRIWASGHTDFAWQPRFYDHIIRDENSLQRIRAYIINNPAQWEEDRHHPHNLGIGL